MLKIDRPFELIEIVFDVVFVVVIIIGMKVERKLMPRKIRSIMVSMVVVKVKISACKEGGQVSGIGGMYFI